MRWTRHQKLISENKRSCLNANREYECWKWHILQGRKSSNNNTGWLQLGWEQTCKCCSFCMSLCIQNILDQLPLGVGKTETLWIANQPYFHLSLSHSHSQPSAACHLSMQSFFTCSQSWSSDWIISDSFM